MKIINNILMFMFILFLIPQVSALTSGEGAVILGAIGSMMVTVIFFLVLSIMAKNVPVKLFFISLAVIILVLSIGFGVSVMQQFFSDFTTLIQSYGAFYRLLTILLMGAGAGLMLWLVVVAFKSFNSYRGIIETGME